MKGIIAGVIAGIVGAVVWAMLAYYANIEIGWLAWGIGGAVGAAVAWGTEGGTVNGVIAVAISIVAILAGKFVTVEMVMDEDLGNAQEIVDAELADENVLILWVARGITAEYEEAGEQLNWPAGVDPSEASTMEEFPPSIREEARTAWASMTDEQKKLFKEYVSEEIIIYLNENASSIKNEGFLASFGIIDVIFFFLAIGTSFKLASGSED